MFRLSGTMKSVIFLATILYISFALECPLIENPVLLPTLDPVQFSYKIQIVVEDKRLTLDAYEFYDHENETVILYVDKNSGIADNTKIVYDYKYNQTFVVETTNGSTNCIVQDLNNTLPHQPTLFGVGVEDGPLSVKNAFYWNSTQYNASSVGIVPLDGIDTHQYSACLSFENTKWIYQVDVFFSLANWSMPAGQNAPVYLKLNATHDNGTSRIYKYYFSDYHTSQTSRSWKPRKPSDMICRGRKDGPVLTFRNHSQYTFSIQTRGTSHGVNFLFEATTYFDYERKLILLDVKTPISSQRIEDFHQGLSYSTNGTSGSCKVSPISLQQNSFLVIVYNNQVRMRSLFDLRRFNLTYGGMTSYKGIISHSWIAQNPVTMYNFDQSSNESLFATYYFAAEKYNGINTLVGIKEIITVNSSIPSQVLYTDVYDEKFDFDPAVFDISGCFDSTTRKTVILKFSDSLQNELRMFPKAFQRAVVAAVSKHSKLEEVRIKFAGSIRTNNKLSSAKNNHDVGGIYVWITMLGVPRVQGDSSEMIPQVNLSNGIANLKKIVKDNSFVVTFIGSKVNTYSAFPYYFEFQDDLLQPQKPNPPAPSPTPAPSSAGVSSGGVAGIAIGMILLGFLFGFGFFYCRNGRLRSQYAYSMQS